MKLRLLCHVGRVGAALLGLALALALAHCGGGDDVAPEDPGADGGRDASREAEAGQRPIERGTFGPSRTEGAGTRFRPQYWQEEYDDGSTLRVFEGIFYDTQENRRCEIGSLADGSWACIPLDTGWASEGFADADCTQPILYETTEEPSRYIRWGARCEARVGFKLLGGDEGVVYLRNSLGQCYRAHTSAMILPFPTPFTAEELGSFTRTVETPTAAPEQSGTRIALESVRFTGADGSFESKAPAAVDREHDREGAFYTAAGGKLHFLPADHWVSESLAFRDAECTEKLVNVGYQPPAACGHTRTLSPYKLQQIDADVGPNCRAVRAVGEPTEPPIESVYIVTNACSPMGHPATDVYAPTAFTERPSTETPEASRQLVPSPNLAIHGEQLEIRSRRTTSIDGLDQTERRVRPFLRKYETACKPERVTGEAQIRCLPDAPVASEEKVFEDKDCSREVLVLDLIPFSCDGDPRFYLALTRENYEFTYQAYRRAEGARLGQDVYYRKGGAACEPFSICRECAAFPAEGAEPIPASEFPTVTGAYIVP